MIDPEELNRLGRLRDNGLISIEEFEQEKQKLLRQTNLVRCPYCKEEIQDGSIKCKHCGEALGNVVFNKDQLAFIRRIADYEKISATIWLVLAIVQFLSVYAVVAGIWNLFASLSRFALVKKIRNADPTVPAAYEGLGQLIAIGLINLFLGGGVGVILVALDFYVRDQILTNRDVFCAKLEQEKFCKNPRAHIWMAPIGIALALIITFVGIGVILQGRTKQTPLLPSSEVSKSIGVVQQKDLDQSDSQPLGSNSQQPDSSSSSEVILMESASSSSNSSGSINAERKIDDEISTSNTPPQGHHSNYSLGISARIVKLQPVNYITRSYHTGALIRESERGSLAHQAGLSRGDVIVEINDNEIQSDYSMQEAVRSLTDIKPNHILIFRDGVIQAVTLNISGFGTRQTPTYGTEDYPQRR